MSRPGGKGGKASGGDDGPQISPEDKARIAKASRQLLGYANFLRWAANFPREELSRHPRHERVTLLSPMTSGRFAFAVEGDILYLGVQAFEAVWLSTLPVEKVYISDRLYLYVEGVPCMDSKLTTLGIGIFVDDAEKRQLMAKAKWCQPVRMSVEDGAVQSIGRPLGQRIPMETKDIERALVAVADAKRKSGDMARFF